MPIKKQGFEDEDGLFTLRTKGLAERGQLEIEVWRVPEKVLPIAGQLIDLVLGAVEGKGVTLNLDEIFVSPLSIEGHDADGVEIEPLLSHRKDGEQTDDVLAPIAGPTTSKLRLRQEIARDVVPHGAGAGASLCGQLRDRQAFGRRPLLGLPMPNPRALDLAQHVPLSAPRRRRFTKKKRVSRCRERRPRGRCGRSIPASGISKTVA
jgi:hypothetical protein